MQGMRETEGFPQAVRHVQNLFQNTFSPGPDPRRDKVELVGVER